MPHSLTVGEQRRRYRGVGAGRHTHAQSPKHRQVLNLARGHAFVDVAVLVVPVRIEVDTGNHRTVVTAAC